MLYSIAIRFYVDLLFIVLNGISNSMPSFDEITRYVQLQKSVDSLIPPTPPIDWLINRIDQRIEDEQRELKKLESDVRNVTNGWQFIELCYLIRGYRDLLDEKKELKLKIMKDIKKQEEREWLLYLKIIHENKRSRDPILEKKKVLV